MENSKLKFRAWDKTRRKMWSHSDLYIMDCSNKYPFLALIKGFYATNMFMGEEMDVIPMQFTGLYDKNGKEIYECDIISTDLDRPFNIVVFRNGAFMFQCHDSGKDYYDYMFSVEEESDRWEYGEVIGNIYENPELLEGEGNA